MAVGRPPKPIEQHRREGTRPNGRGSSDPKPVLLAGREVPDMPPGLPAEARPVWELVVADLKAGRVIDGADWPAIENFCVQVARARQARKAIEFEKREAAERRRRAPELLRQYEADMERWRAGELKSAPREPDVDMNPQSHLTQSGQKGAKVQSVYLQVEREAWKEARQVGDTLGLSPSARARLGLNVKGSGRKHGASDAGRGVPESPRRGLRAVQGGQG